MTMVTLKDTYNCIAEHWRADHAKDSWWIVATDAFIGLLKPGSDVLDVGCGVGLKAEYLIRHGLKVTGIDFSEKMIAYCRKHVSCAEFRVMDMADVGGLQRTFDGIYMCASLLHIRKADVEKVLLGLSDRLRPGGYLCIIVKERHEDQPEEGILKEEDYGYPYERFFSYFTRGELRLCLESLGMEVVHESRTPSCETMWIQAVGRKPEA